MLKSPPIFAYDVNYTQIINQLRNVVEVEQYNYIVQNLWLTTQ